MAAMCYMLGARDSYGWFWSGSPLSRSGINEVSSGRSHNPSRQNPQQNTRPALKSFALPILLFSRRSLVSYLADLARERLRNSRSPPANATLQRACRLPTVEMGLFTRRAHNGPAATNGHAVRGRHEPYSMATRPTFGQWLRYAWLDLLTMVAMGALGLGVSWLASPCVRVLGGWQITDENFFVPADIRSSPCSVPLVSCHLLRRGDSLT